MKLKSFQKHDLARLALHDGGILGWDKGLGKTLGMFLWCLLKVGREKGEGRTADPLAPLISHLSPQKPCLLVAPGDVHDAVADEARNMMRFQPVTLDSQATFLRLSTLDPQTGARALPAAFYLASYTQLAVNKVARFPDFDDHSDEAMMDLLGLQWQDVQDFFDRRGVTYADEYASLETKPDWSYPKLERQRDRLVQVARRNGQEWHVGEVLTAFAVLQHFHGDQPNTPLLQLPVDSQHFIRKAMMVRKRTEYSAGIGEVRTVAAALVSAADQNQHPANPSSPLRIKCIYDPSLADLCMDTFAAVAIDEGTRIKGEDSLIGVGLRQLNPKYRLVLTGTPIKNRVPDIFRLAHWATGGHDEATARWPYACASSEREAFAEEFLVSEKNLTKEQNSETGRRYRKLTPQVCNIHRLWKLLGPIVLRRLKKDIGEHLVPKHRHVIRVPMGTEQALVYRHHLEGEYLDRNGRPATGAKLQALRSVAAAPHSALLCYAPQPKHAPPLPARSSTSWLPKYAAALALMEQAMRRGEQFVLFSALIEPLETLSRRLTEAGVPHLVAHGGSSPAKRRKISHQFKQGPPPRTSHLSPLTSPHIPILLASGECMAEAHSWHLCNNVALLAYSWAFDKLSQCIDRCHRLNSVKALNYHAILCDGSVDRKLEENLHEKADTSDLVLDGHLLGENPQEVNLADILRIAAAEFKPDSKTVDEAVIEAEWPALRQRLRQAAEAWHSPGSVIETMASTPAKESNLDESVAMSNATTVHPWSRLRGRRQSAQAAA